MNANDILFYGMLGSAGLLICAIFWVYYDNSLVVQEFIVVFWMVWILFCSWFGNIRYKKE